VLPPGSEAPVMKTPRSSDSAVPGVDIGGRTKYLDTMVSVSVSVEVEDG